MGTITLDLALKYIFLITFGFSSGLIISGAVFAFISVIGVVQRLAQKTHTEQYIRIYEHAIMFGGIFGGTTLFIDYKLHVGKPIVIILSFCLGIFYGLLAVSLAEVVKVIPILTRRIKVQKGMFFFILAIAFGKLMGSVLYFVVPNFFKMD